jgi:hypothetical protein
LRVVGEAVLEWDGGRTWYRLEGELPGNRPAPLVILDGGPGAAHEYVDSIAALAPDGLLCGPIRPGDRGAETNEGDHIQPDHPCGLDDRCCAPS